MAHATPVASDVADFKRGECEGRTVSASSHNPKDYAGALRTGGFSRSAGSPREGRADGASIGIPGEIEVAGRLPQWRSNYSPACSGCPGVPEISPAEIS